MTEKIKKPSKTPETTNTPRRPTTNYFKPITGRRTTKHIQPRKPRHQTHPTHASNQTPQDTQPIKEKSNPTRPRQQLATKPNKTNHIVKTHLLFSAPAARNFPRYLN